MLAKRILGANHYLGAPAGWEPEKDGKCAHLAIRTQGNPRHGDGWCESAWEPTSAELEALNAGGSIILRIVGWQPPVALYVEAQPRDPVEAPAVESGVTGETTICPKCELDNMVLAHFCQNAGCPIRAHKGGHRG